MNISEYHNSKNTYDKNSFEYICCGCEACANICPKNCISMISNEEGFVYPDVEQSKCIDCNKCISSCQYINKKISTVRLQEPLIYAAKCLDINNLSRSSSGGLSYAIATTIIEKWDGVVAGAVYDENMAVNHIFIDNKEDLYRIQGSKYVQSNMGSTYKETKKYLEKGKYVLFTGTPCQVSGLYQFLEKDYENLYTTDIICFGVPSPKVFRGYIKWEEKRKKSNITPELFTVI